MNAEAFSSSDECSIVGFPRSGTIINLAHAFLSRLLMYVLGRRLYFLAPGKSVAAAAVIANRRMVQMPKNVSVDNSELTTLLKDASSTTRKLLTAWADIPLLSMLETDWERGPLVLIGLND